MSRIAAAPPCHLIAVPVQLRPGIGQNSRFRKKNSDNRMEA
jgi:hypothetical protein